MSSLDMVFNEALADLVSIHRFAMNLDDTFVVSSHSQTV